MKDNMHMAEQTTDGTLGTAEMGAEMQRKMSDKAPEPQPEEVVSSEPPKDEEPVSVELPSGGPPQPNEEERYFQSSTHYYLLYGDKTIYLLGIGVLVLQFVLYCIIIGVGVKDYSEDKIPVMVSTENCGGRGFVKEADDLECEIEYNDFGFLVLANILAAIFILYDYLVSFKILFFEHHPRCGWTRFAALLILVEAIMATITCSVFALNGWYNGSVYDAIANTVGVLFIHDIDEKLFEAVSIIKPKDTGCACCCDQGKCCRKYMPSWCTLCCISIVAVIGLLVAAMVGLSFIDDFDEGFSDDSEYYYYYDSDYYYDSNYYNDARSESSTTTTTTSPF